MNETPESNDEWKERYERLNESLAKNKRLFSSKLAETIIANQVKRIKHMEDKYEKANKERQFLMDAIAWHERNSNHQITHTDEMLYAALDTVKNQP